MWIKVCNSHSKGQVWISFVHAYANIRINLGGHTVASPLLKRSGGSHQFSLSVVDC